MLRYAEIGGMVFVGMVDNPVDGDQGGESCWVMRVVGR